MYFIAGVARHQFGFCYIIKYGYICTKHGTIPRPGIIYIGYANTNLLNSGYDLRHNERVLISKKLKVRIVNL